MRTLVAAMALALLSCGYAAPAPSAAKETRAVSSGPTDEAYVRAFLETWLVERNVEAARAFLAPDFYIHPALRNPNSWPESIRSKPEAERALRFPFACSGAPPACRRLGDCIRSSEGRSVDFDIEPMKVDAQMIASNPELRSREGQDVVLVSFTLNGCNIGASLLFAKNASDSHRILTIFYLAG